MPKNTYTPFYALSANVIVRTRESVEEKAPVELTDEYLEFMQRQIDAEKPKNFKLTPTSPSGW